jgi:hypothetical protein
MLFEKYILVGFKILHCQKNGREQKEYFLFWDYIKLRLHLPLGLKGGKVFEFYLYFTELPHHFFVILIPLIPFEHSDSIFGCC